MGEIVTSFHLRLHYGFIFLKNSPKCHIFKKIYPKCGDFSHKCGDFEEFLSGDFVAIFDNRSGDFEPK